MTQLCFLFNTDDFPALNFAFHCGTSVSPEYPFLLRCPDIEQGIKKCQDNGKKVVLSIGGAGGTMIFDSEADATLFAQRLYNLFLDGNEYPDLRPFGT